MKTVAIVQARMGSNRLPGKVLMDLKGNSVLGHVIERLNSVPLIDEVVIATTTKSDDELIVEEAKRLNVSYYRGDEENVLSRYYEAAKLFNADTIVRVTSDCPLIDPEVTNNTIKLFYRGTFDYVSNTIDRSFPRGLDTEVFSIKSLETSFNKCYTEDHKEHVTPYIYQHPHLFNMGFYKGEENYSDYRWTLDTQEDYQLINEIYQHLYATGRIFHWKEVIQLMLEKPELPFINAHVEQKKLSE